MTDDHTHAELPNRWYKTQLVLFISGSIVIAVVLVLVSMALYASSGAAQLDLSRPGYQSVQSKVEKPDAFKSFPSTGTVDQKAIDQFQKLYDEQVQQVTSVDVFTVDVLENQALGIDALAAEPVEQ